MSTITMPGHIAISLDDISKLCRVNHLDINETCSKYFNFLGKLIELQIKSNIKVLTIYLLSDRIDGFSDYIAFQDWLASFFNELTANQIVIKHKIKISIFGKWYNLSGRVVESLKNIIEQTKDNDSFYVNFCINYDGQEEIVDACRLIAKQVQLGKVDTEMITKETIKKNIYSSYFTSPELILIYGEKILSGILLWDSVNSKVIFLDKSFIDFKEEDIVGAF